MEGGEHSQVLYSMFPLSYSARRTLGRWNRPANPLICFRFDAFGGL
jgi:hypothetical protein